MPRPTTNKSSPKRNNRRRASSKSASRKRSLPMAPPPTAPHRSRRNGSGGGGETELRYLLASLVRLSDNLVMKAVDGYNRLFQLRSEDQADIYLQMAREFERDGKRDEALEALRKANLIRPSDPDVLTRIGLIHMKQRAFGAALKAFEEAKALGHKSHRLCISLADVLLEQGKHDEAAAELERAILLQPDSAPTHYRLGLVLDRLGRYEDAAHAFSRAVDLEPSEVTYHQSLGFALESAGSRKAAIECFKRALELEHSDAE